MCAITRKQLGNAVFAAASLSLLPFTQHAYADFDLSGKSVTFIVGGGPGGGVDAFARTIAPYLTKHLPGSPVVKVGNMGASGGLQGVQYLYNVAAGDGTFIGTTNAGPVSEPLMGQVKVNYDVARFRWIGSLTTGDTVCAVWHQSSIKTIDDARKRDVPMASTGATSAPTRATLMAAYLLGAHFKPIPGYDGGTSLLAIERREVDGSCTTLGSLRTTRPDWIANRQLRILVQVSMTKDPEFPDVPRLVDLIANEEHKQMLEFMLIPYEFNNPLMLPPGASDEALKVWRTAFSKAVRDPDYLADAGKRLQKITPKSGDEVEALVNKMLTTPPAIIKRVIETTDIKQLRN